MLTKLEIECRVNDEKIKEFKNSHTRQVLLIKTDHERTLEKLKSKYIAHLNEKEATVSFWKSRFNQLVRISDLRSVDEVITEQYVEKQLKSVELRDNLVKADKKIAKLQDQLSSTRFMQKTRS